MAEENEIGVHTFVAMWAAQPFPASLHQAGKDGVSLDRILLGHLQRHYAEQNRSHRALFAVDIGVQAEHLRGC